MSEIHNEIRDRKPISAYQQLSGILNAIKTDEISVNDAMNKIQLREQSSNRPYCKVVAGGTKIALNGITPQPIVLSPYQWNKLQKVIKSNYIENYMKYNENRIKPYSKNNNHYNKNHSNLNEDTTLEEIIGSIDNA
jgi:hypothetical protein